MIMLSILALSAVSGGLFLTAYMFGDEEGRECLHPFRSVLTDGLRQEIMDRIREMRQAKASRQEIKKAIDAKLESGHRGPGASRRLA
ncbi:hypothetical protein KEJ39_06120 [Candidatus Bathyarchaeota archaeon]|nr:hypothetical protein [Candidatus Bathyarchaeota archaeon]